MYRQTFKNNRFASMEISERFWIEYDSYYSQTFRVIIKMFLYGILQIKHIKHAGSIEKMSRILYNIRDKGGMLNGKRVFQTDSRTN